MQKAAPNKSKTTGPKISAEALKAANKVESWVQHLEKFKKHEPTPGRNGCDLIGNFSRGMHAGDVFLADMDVQTGLQRVAALKENLELRVLKDHLYTAGDIDKAMKDKGGPDAVKTVNRWKYFGQKLKAKEETAHLESELYKTLEGLAKAVEDLEDCLKAQVKK
jgi:hypothetical protein